MQGRFPTTNGEVRACHPWLPQPIDGSKMRALLVRLQSGLRWKRARPPRNFERFIGRKPAPREGACQMLPPHQPFADLVIAIGPPSGNARDPRAFSGPSFGPIAFPPHALPEGRLPSKCARSSRVCKRVFDGNVRDPRAILRGSFGENEGLECALVSCCRPPTGGRSRDCDTVLVGKRARPPRIFGRFNWAHRVPAARTAGRLAAIQMRA